MKIIIAIILLVMLNELSEFHKDVNKLRDQVAHLTTILGKK